MSGEQRVTDTRRRSPFINDATNWADGRLEPDGSDNQVERVNGVHRYSNQTRSVSVSRRSESDYENAVNRGHVTKTRSKVGAGRQKSYPAGKAACRKEVRGTRYSCVIIHAHLRRHQPAIKRRYDRLM